MKKRLLIVAGALLALGIAFEVVSEAWAACPLGTTYSCYQGYNGKVICACR